MEFESFDMKLVYKKVRHFRMFQKQNQPISILNWQTQRLNWTIRTLLMFIDEIVFSNVTRCCFKWNSAVTVLNVDFTLIFIFDLNLLTVGRAHLRQWHQQYSKANRNLAYLLSTGKVSRYGQSLRNVIFFVFAFMFHVLPTHIFTKSKILLLLLFT